MRTLLLAFVLAAPLSAVAARVADAAPGASTKTVSAPATVAVVGPRIFAADVIDGCSDAAAAVDLGPTPAVGASRLVTREEVAKTFAERGVALPAAVPSAVRVIRKTEVLTAGALEQEIRAAVAKQPLRKGATIVAVKAPKSTEIVAGATSTTVEIPKPPRKAGPLTTTATVTFLAGPSVLARVMVPVDLVLGPEAAQPDVAAKSTITLVVRKGLVEIAAPATATADADVGEIVPVVVKATGRIVQARVVTKERVVALEAS
jgi:flagella basal body P-ring formation protein FlgA